MKILRANVSNNEVSYEEVPESWLPYGGRALVARFLLDEVPPSCDPLGPLNKLIWAPGLLVGHMLSSIDRISLGGKSPLTGGVKEANAGGTTGMRMAWLDLFALILEGMPPADGPWQLLYIGQEGARFEPADDLVSLGLHETGQRLRERFDDKIGVSAIGPGGERLQRAAGITHIDKDRNLTRISARGGLGAVMGAKRLKALVFDKPRSKKPAVRDSKLFQDASRQYLKALQEHPQTSEVYTEYGTAAMVNMCNTRGGMPTRNFSSGTFEAAEAISGETIRILNESRGGDISHACMAGCIIKCSNIYVGEDGQKLVTPLEYETIGLMGSNLGIEEPDIIAQLNDVANDLGLDSIDVGAALGVAAEAGYMTFGDGQAALRLMEEVRIGSPLGRIIANGAALAGQVLGVRRVPVVKNQAISAYDPRAIKGTGVTYATSPQGADHTSGLTIRAQIDHLKPEGQVELSRTTQFKMAGYDSLGACIFGGFGLDAKLTRDLINGRYEWGVDENYLSDLGRQTIAMEREFNHRAGFTAADDRLPEWMTQEQLPPFNTVFDVHEDELDAIFDDS
ncbi:MAG TPA: aldehyde ferredoxin oxidoreductase C-terminal domain-containing protein [Anaerolineae bacterium]|jgi:aldehyde:ferredoxin oxidoreductase|nr:aldehyde ferredoxin oxidoreductase C-terminal domain-containing protein [Anaerolineae bacterium]